MKSTGSHDNVLTLALVTLVLISLCSLVSCLANDDEKALVSNVEKLGQYIVKSTFAFTYPESYPPRTESELKAICKLHADSIKYIRQQSKGTPSIIRRGFLAFTSSRQPHIRKYCTNTTSEASQKFIAATKCFMEKKLAANKEFEEILSQSFVEIGRRNYTDPSPELKQICCVLHKYRANQKASIGPECEEHRAILEEMLEQIVSNDLDLVCDDDEKLAKSCAKLEPLKFKRIANYTTPSGICPAGLTIYLVATLGEPNDPKLFY